MKVSQMPGARVGTISNLEDGWLRISVPFMAQVLIDPLNFGQSTPILVNMAVSLVGDFKVTPEGPVFAHIIGEGGDNWSRKVDLHLEDQSLTSQLQDQSKVDFRVKSRLKNVKLALNGIRQFYATGTQIEDH
jgi:hypothetical protein